jgi:probable LLM family oxidoreductase
MIEIGIDSFAAWSVGDDGGAATPADAMRELVARVVHAEACGLDVFGIGEHHRAEFLDSAPAMILAAAASVTKKIKLTSAVTVLSAADPVRVFQQFATLDLLSAGRAEMVVGRGSFTESFPLFGLALEDYDTLFAEKLDLLLEIRDHEKVWWQGEHQPPVRAALTGQGVYPRPVVRAEGAKLPIWLGVGGTPQSFARAGALGLPLMVAIIGGETHRFRPLVDLYYEAGKRAGHARESLKVGVHALGYVAETDEQAAEDFFPGYAKTFGQVGKERGWGSITRRHFDQMLTPEGALLVGSAATVAAKIAQHSAALGGVSRFTFQMDVGALPQAKLLRSIELIGEKVRPVVRRS